MVVLVYFWKINLRSLPSAILHMALDRLTLRRNQKITFFKSLGTGKGETFTPNDADAKRWGLLVVIDASEVNSFDASSLISNWRNISTAEYRAVLQPISAHGLWSKQEPFNQNQISNWQGPVAAITRARIKWSMNQKFWRAVPPVTVSLKSSPGLLSAIGIGEAPIGFQGTFSRWESGAALRSFAYQGQAHIAAIQATKDLDWYAEELFARFAIIDEHGGI
tara:strand:- start:329 stop:991 length:663 start_codon:yes stop_codon:yes gene_type:complete